MAPSYKFKRPLPGLTPLLDQHLQNGTIKVDFTRREYYGNGHDGVELSLGAIGGEPMLERYLTTHPTPDTW